MLQVCHKLQSSSMILSIVSPVTSSVCLIFLTKGSITNAKREGDKGHPCPVPLVNEKGFEIITFMYTNADGKRNAE